MHPAIIYGQFKKNNTTNSKIPRYLKGKNNVAIFYDFNNCEIYTDDYIHNLGRRNKKTTYNLIINAEDSTKALDYLRHSVFYNENRIHLSTFPLESFLNTYFTRPTAICIKRNRYDLLKGNILKINPDNFILDDSIEHNSIKQNLAAFVCRDYHVIYNEDNNTFYSKNIKTKKLDSINLQHFIKSKTTEYYSSNYDSTKLSKILFLRNSNYTTYKNDFILNPFSINIDNNILYFSLIIKLLDIVRDTAIVLNTPAFIQINLDQKSINLKDFTHQEYFNNLYIESVKKIEGDRYSAILRPLSEDNIVIQTDSNILMSGTFRVDSSNQINLIPLKIPLKFDEYKQLTMGFLFSLDVFNVSNKSWLISSSNKIYNTDLENRKMDTIPISIKTGSSYIDRTFKHENKFYIIICNYANKTFHILKTSDFLNYKSFDYNYDKKDIYINSIDKDEKCNWIQYSNKKVYFYSSTLSFK